MNTYQIHLAQFEGPFDLLLFFIERDELDIYDIPVSQITKDFLDYLHSLEKMEIEIASEFILMAATLIKIKTKMLIPRPTENSNGEIEDPRKELVHQLVVYKQFKAIQKEFEQIEELSLKRFASGAIRKISNTKPEDELQTITLFRLMTVYQKVLESYKSKMKKPSHVIQKYPYTPEEVKKYIFDKIEKLGRVDFISFVSEKPEKLFFIFSFLSILELVQYKQIRVIVGDGFNNFWITGIKEEIMVQN